MTRSCVAMMVVFAHCTLCIERRELTDLSEYIGSMDVSQIAQQMQMQAERIQMQDFPAFKDAGRRFSFIKSTESQAQPGVRKI
jgi:hypothetical protein